VLAENSTKPFNSSVIEFLDIIHRPVFYLKQRSGDWILPPSSGKQLRSLAQSTELVPISGH
jgi:hypothetical protein